MQPIEIIIIILVVLFLGFNLFLYLRRKKKGYIGCASECGCQAVEDMKRSFKEAKKSLEKSQEEGKK